MTMQVDEFRIKMNKGITNPEHRAANDKWLTAVMGMLKPGGTLIVPAHGVGVHAPVRPNKTNKAARKAAKQARRKNRK